MSKQTHQTPPRFWIYIAFLLAAAFGCKLSSLPGQKVNLFEGTNAQDAATKIKQKIGVDVVKVSSMEIHEDKLEMVIQAPSNAKNFDKYTFSRGAVTGPEPQEALVLGNNELTADKMRMFDLSEVNLAAMPDVCRKAVERAQIEQGKVDSISIDWESAENTRSKEEKAKRDAEEKKRSLEDRFSKLPDHYRDLVVTWRIWVKGPRMTKYFWADKNGNLGE